MNIAKANCTQGENSIPLSPKVDNPIGGHGNLPKGEIPDIYVWQDGYDLLFGQDYAGCLLTISAGDDIVYSAYIPVTGILSIPTSLSGTYDITLYFDIYCFVGEITL